MVEAASAPDEDRCAGHGASTSLLPNMIYEIISAVETCTSSPSKHEVRAKNPCRNVHSEFPGFRNVRKVALGNLLIP